MFTSSVIGRPSVSRSEESPLGSMHLNAINGSSDSNSFSPFSSGHSSQPRAIGGLYGASLSDNHPYRPQDSGTSFHETKKNSGQSAGQSAPTGDLVTPSKPPSYHYNCNQIITRQRETLENLRSTIMASPEVPRRRSLDLDHKGKPHSYCDELLMSLEEAEMLRSRSSPLADDVAALSLNEHHTLTHEAAVYDTEQRDSRGEPKLTQELKKRRRYHTADSATTERAIKLLEKIKDSKKDASAATHKHSKLREEEEDDRVNNRQATSPSKATGSSRHNVLRHLSDTAQPKDKAPSGSRRSKDSKLLSRASVD